MLKIPTLAELDQLCSKSESNEHLCNSYQYWNQRSIDYFLLPLSVIPVESRHGRYQIPVERFAILYKLLHKISSTTDLAEIVDLIGMEFPDLLNFVLVFGITNLHNPERRPLSKTEIRDSLYEGQIIMTTTRRSAV
jgi:hypothetical protein